MPEHNEPKNAFEVGRKVNAEKTIEEGGGVKGFLLGWVMQLISTRLA